MTTGLIGHTGLVGSNLLGPFRPDQVYNSSVMSQIHGRHFRLLVNAGVPGTKWLANRDGEADRSAILGMWNDLRTVTADVVVQISTIDVFPRGSPAYEDTEIREDLLEPYGRNRLELERLVREHFPCVLIVRLAHIFGPGIKKGFVYDLIHSHALDWTDRRDVFQPYDLRHLWRDISVFLERGLHAVNVSTEPISAELLAREAFGIEFVNECDREPRIYDVRTQVDYLASGRRGYMYEREEVLADLTRFRLAQVV